MSVSRARAKPSLKFSGLLESIASFWFIFCPTKPVY